MFFFLTSRLHVLTFAFFLLFFSISSEPLSPNQFISLSFGGRKTVTQPAGRFMFGKIYIFRLKVGCNGFFPLPRPFFFFPSFSHIFSPFPPNDLIIFRQENWFFFFQESHEAILYPMRNEPINFMCKVDVLILHNNIVTDDTVV